MLLFVQNNFVYKRYYKRFYYKRAIISKTVICYSKQIKKNFLDKEASVYSKKNFTT